MHLEYDTSSTQLSGAHESQGEIHLWSPRLRGRELGEECFSIKWPIWICGLSLSVLWVRGAFCRSGILHFSQPAPCIETLIIWSAKREGGQKKLCRPFGVNFVESSSCRYWGQPKKTLDTLKFSIKPFPGGGMER